uniref:Large ribosomal subunit protein P2 n=1 Tax=Ixodes ricinus TaxID=34613 RepID=A0A131YBK8_IXORI
MRYVAAYLLAAMGGNKDPSAADVEKILGSVGIESDAERVKKVISELKGKSVEDVIAKGKEKLASMPSGGGGAAPAAVSPAAGGAAAAPKEAAKKEEKKEESEESGDDMGFGLFD